MRSSADYARFDDERLLRLVAQSRQEALSQLYDRYSRLVFSLALFIVADRSTAEEITLDVFLRVWQKAATYDPSLAGVRTWLTHITRNHTIDVLRRRKARPDQLALSLEQLPSRRAVMEHDPQEIAEGSFRREQVQSALAQLPADQQQVLLLAFFGGYTQSQIAELLNQPLGTVKTRVRLGMQKLRDLLQEQRPASGKSVSAPAAYNISEEEV